MIPTTTRRRQPATLGRAVALVVAAAFAAAGALTSCGEGGPEPQTIQIVVPEGTQQRLDAGESVDVMPARLDLRVGDTLLIRNDDVVTQSVGPYLVRAGREIRLTYGAEGRYEGYCPLSEGERYEIVVEG